MMWPASSSPELSRAALAGRRATAACSGAARLLAAPGFAGCSFSLHSALADLNFIPCENSFLGPLTVLLGSLDKHLVRTGTDMAWPRFPYPGTLFPQATSGYSVSLALHM